MLIVVYDHENIGLDIRSFIEYLYPKIHWNIEFSKMAVANLHIYDDNCKLEICLLYSVIMKNMGLDTKRTLIKYLYPKLQ